MEDVREFGLSVCGVSFVTANLEIDIVKENVCKNLAGRRFCGAAVGIVGGRDNDTATVLHARAD